MRIIKYLLPIAMIVIAVLVAKVVVENPPKAKPQAKPDHTALMVDAIHIKPSEYQVNIESYGTIQPVMESAIIPEVSGKIISVSPEFEDGGKVNQGEIVVEIDPADYAIAIKTAAANLTQARATLSEEKARSQEAVKDWKRLGRSGDPSNLVARIPQLSAARAKVISAQAQLEKTNLDLERTKIRAPYPGRIRNKKAGLGQFVSKGTVLAELFSSETFKLRLPLTQSDLKWLSIPKDATETGSIVIFTVGDEQQQSFAGRIKRSEGVLDPQTRQLFVTAIVQADKANTFLAIGQFLKANILGKRFEQVYKIPSGLIDDNDQVIIVKDGKLKKKAVNIVWRNEQISIVDSGITKEDWLLTTLVGEQIKKLEVRISDESKRFQIQ